MKKESLNPALIRAVYSSYRNQRRILNELNMKLSTASDRDEWTSVFLKRSDTLHVAFDVNTETGALLANVLFNEGKLTYEYSEAFLREYYNTLSDGEKDIYYSCLLLERLTAYYRKNHDLLRLLPALIQLGQLYTSTVKMHFDSNYNKALSCFREVLTYKNNYNLIPDISIRKVFFEAYYNLCCVLPIIETKSTIPASSSLDYLLDVLSFYNSPLVQKLDGNSEEIRISMERIKENWLWIEYRIDTADSETRSAFIQLSHDVYDAAVRQFNDDIMRIPVYTLISYQHALILEGSTSYIDAVNYMTDLYYKKREMVKDTLSPETFDLTDFYYQTKIPIAMIKWLDKIDILSEMCSSMKNRLIEDLNDYYRLLSERRIYSHVIFESICEWCFFVIDYINSTEEKERFLIDMLINRQPQTFFDAHISSDLVALIAESLYTQKSVLLTSVENHLRSWGRPAGRLDVIRFIRKCALFHDIGLNKLNAIHGIEFRALYDEEKEVLKRHVELGAELFTGDLAIYRDAIIGHHKSYDQTEGYPENTDMSNSPLRIVCDIISICDALNSATDSIGRCYKDAKDFSIILSELITLSGSKYNTSLVNLFLDDTELSCKIDSLLSNNRMETYYDYYARYFEKSSKSK